MAKFAVVLVLLVAAGAGGGWFWLQGQVSAATAALKADADAVAAERIPRPLFAAPMVKGSFAACAEGRVKSNADLLDAEPEACRAFRAPKTPPAKVPDECLALVTPKNALAWARGLMGCAHADSVGERIDPAGYAAWQTAAKMLAWEVRGNVAAGQVTSAFETCLDVFGTARDLVPHGGAEGLGAADALVRTVYPACSDAVVRADGVSRKAFTNALELIRQGKWANAKLIRDARVRALDPKRASGPMAQWELVKAHRRSVAVEAVADTLDPDRATALKAIEGSAADDALLKKADALDALLEMLVAASSETEKPASTSRYTVVPGEPGALLTPVEPASAPLAIQLLR